MRVSLLSTSPICPWEAYFGLLKIHIYLSMRALVCVYVYCLRAGCLWRPEEDMFAWNWNYRWLIDAQCGFRELNWILSKSQTRSQLLSHLLSLPILFWWLKLCQTFSLPQGWGYTHICEHIYLFSHMCWGFTLRSSCLCSRRSYTWAISQLLDF